MAETDPTGGLAKATEAAADASKELVTAAREFGGFISGPIGEIVGMLHDHLKVVRFERQVRLIDRVRTFMHDRGLVTPTRQIPLNLGLPLLDHATLEEDDDLQDLWAMLLVNGGDADSGTDLRKAFISILDDLGSFDAKLLAKISAESSAMYPGVYTFRLPDEIIPYRPLNPIPVPREDVALALWNLGRLGCVEPIAGWDGTHIHHVRLTPLGKAFMSACSSK